MRVLIGFHETIFEIQIESTQSMYNSLIIPLRTKYDIDIDNYFLTYHNIILDVNKTCDDYGVNPDDLIMLLKR